MCGTEYAHQGLRLFRIVRLCRCTAIFFTVSIVNLSGLVSACATLIRSYYSFIVLSVPAVLARFLFFISVLKRPDFTFIEAHDRLYCFLLRVIKDLLYLIF